MFGCNICKTSHYTPGNTSILSGKGGLEHIQVIFILSYSSGRQGNKSKSCRKQKVFLIFSTCFAFFTLKLTILADVRENRLLYVGKCWKFCKNPPCFPTNILWIKIFLPFDLVTPIKSRVEARITIQKIKSLGVLQTETCH